jgi:tRNA (cmo5U34)-methyltransferase
LAERPVRLILDLGIGTGALARACLSSWPVARLWGIDADAAMLRVARARLARFRRRVTIVEGSFLDARLPRCDAIVASYALHHIRRRRAKQAFYRRCFSALRRGGVLVSGDSMPASTRRGFDADLEVWFSHLRARFRTRARARQVYESWADEDVYVPLAEEIEMLRRAGFTVDVPWRRSPFAVLAVVKPRGASRA